MHKSLIGLAAATALGLATLAGPTTANAGCYGCAVGAGVLGGVAAGAIIGSAIANSPPPPPPPATIRRRRRPPITRRPARATRNSRPAAIGASARSGSKASATAGAPFRSASNAAALRRLPVMARQRKELG